MTSQFLTSQLTIRLTIIDLIKCAAYLIFYKIIFSLCFFTIFTNCWATFNASGSPFVVMTKLRQARECIQTIIYGNISTYVFLFLCP